MRGRRCKVCLHRDRTLIDGSIRAGISPRSIKRSFNDLTRAAITRHARECLAEPTKGARE